MKKITLLGALMGLTMAANALVYNVTVPTGTNECYIAGEMTSWSHQKMSKVDDTHYTIDIADATQTQKYKYCSGPDWAYTEKTADGQDVQDRTYNANDVVAKWAAIYDPSVGEQRADVTVRIQSASVPTIWWWGGGIASADQSYTWETKPAMNAMADATGWYEWTFENVNIAIGVSYKIVIDGQESQELNAKEDVCLNASFTATNCPGTEEPVEPSEGITVKVQIPEGLSYWNDENGVYFYVWTTGEGTFILATDEGNRWYSYSTESAPFNFIVVNGSNWPEGTANQTVDMMNVTASACYVLANGEQIDGNGDSWKKTLTATDCPSEGPSTIVEVTENASLFSINGRTLNVSMENEAEISIYTVSGQMIEHTVASNLTREMQQGVYVVRIGNQAQKLVVF